MTGASGSDLLQAVKNGTPEMVAHALGSARQLGNRPSACKSWPLHMAVWRNHPPIVALLLEAGCGVDCADAESGWTGLHKALYWGHLQVAVLLLARGASLELQDNKGRTPLDLLSRELALYLPRPELLPEGGSGAGQRCSLRPNTAVYSWGSGANYQLGTGSTDHAQHPVRVEALGEQGALLLSAAKFHCAAVAQDGRLWTWGWGRGGRLGHPDFNIHSGAAALIQPWLVAGLGKRQVRSVCAAKHHTLVATSSGEVWSWGSNRDGKLGYGGCDSQPVPKRVSGLQRVRVVLVAAANKHSAALSAGGEVFTWGANGSGQLGFGTCDSASNPTPRLVDAMKGKVVVGLSLAKHHSLVVTAEGEAYTWGHTLVTPRRLQLAGSRDTARSKHRGSCQASTKTGTAPAPSLLLFHKEHPQVMRPQAVAVAAGAAVSGCLTKAGVLLAWRSADPLLQVQEVGGGLAAQRLASISASKTRLAATTCDGHLYILDAAAAAAAATPPPATNPALGPSPSPALGPGSARKGQGQGQGQEAPPPPGPPGPAPGGAASGAGPKGLGLLLGARAVRVPGLCRVVQVALGDSHCLGLTCWAVPDPGSLAGPPDPSPNPPQAAAAGQEQGEGEGGGGRGDRWRGGAPKRGQAGQAAESGAQPMHDVEGAGGAVGGPAAAGSWSEAQGRAVGVVQGGAGGGEGAEGQAGAPPPAGRHPGLQGASGPGSPGSWTARGALPAAHGQWGPAAASTPPAAPPPLPRSDGSSGAAGRVGEQGPGAASVVPEKARWWGGGGDGDGVGGAGAGAAAAVPSLQVLSQRVVAQRLVEPRSALQLLEYADVAGAQLLRSFCLTTILRNLDLVLCEGLGPLQALPPHLLAELEQHYKAWLQPAHHHHTPAPTTTTPRRPQPSEQGGSSTGSSSGGGSVSSSSTTTPESGQWGRWQMPGAGGGLEAGAEGRGVPAGGLGGTPLGSSLDSGSWVARAAARYLESGQLGASGAEPGGSQPPSGSGPEPSSWGASAGLTPPDPRSGSGTGYDSALDWFPRQPLLSSTCMARGPAACGLLARRPTSVPPWLEGQQAYEALLPVVQAQRVGDVAVAASSALSHPRHLPPPPLPHGIPGAVTGGAGVPAPSQQLFRSHGSATGAAAAEAASVRLASTLMKKLQQIATLQERAAVAASSVATGSGARSSPGQASEGSSAGRGGFDGSANASKVSSLNSQQLVRLSQRAALQEALAALQAGASVAHVLKGLDLANEVTARLAAVSSARPGVPPLQAGPGPERVAGSRAAGGRAGGASGGTHPAPTTISGVAAARSAAAIPPTAAAAAAAPGGGPGADGACGHRLDAPLPSQTLTATTNTTTNSSSSSRGGALLTPPAAAATEAAPPSSASAPPPAAPLPPSSAAAAAPAARGGPAAAMGSGSAAGGGPDKGSSRDRERGSARKGDLAMFLAGALDKGSVPLPPPLGARGAAVSQAHPTPPGLPRPGSQGAVAGLASTPASQPPPRAPAWGGAGLATAAPAPVVCAGLGPGDAGVAAAQLAAAAAGAGAGAGGQGPCGTAAGVEAGAGQQQQGSGAPLGALRELLGPQLPSGSISAAAGGRGAGKRQGKGGAVAEQQGAGFKTPVGKGRPGAPQPAATPANLTPQFDMSPFQAAGGSPVPFSLHTASPGPHAALSQDGVPNPSIQSSSGPKLLPPPGPNPSLSAVSSSGAGAAGSTRAGWDPHTGGGSQGQGASRTPGSAPPPSLTSSRTPLAPAVTSTSTSGAQGQGQGQGPPGSGRAGLSLADFIVPKPSRGSSTSLNSLGQGAGQGKEREAGRQGREAAAAGGSGSSSRAGPPSSPGSSSAAKVWGGVVPGSSPPGGLAPQLSLRDIQVEQEKRRATLPVWAGGRERSAKASSGGTAVLGSSPPATKWYVPEPLRPQAIQHIQTEESAIKALEKLYGTGVSVMRADAGCTGIGGAEVKRS